MNINIEKLLSGAQNSRGLVVIIDVFRAFSTSCYIYNNNVKRLLVTDNPDIAYNLKKANPDYILVGERNGKKLKSFDFGNSPYEIKNENFSNRTVVLTTSSGTKGLINAKKGKRIITGSFVNAQAISKYIKDSIFNTVTLVAMGDNAKKINKEDMLCAEYLKSDLCNKKINYDKGKLENILKDSAGKRFFDNSVKDSYPEDFYMCLDLNKFNFVLESRKIKEHIFEFKKV